MPIILTILASGQLFLLGWGLGKGLQIISGDPKEIRLPLAIRIALSISLVLTAFLVSLSLHNIPGNLVFSGMVLSFLGDMFNAGVFRLPVPRLGGMIAFGAAHCFYIAAFCLLLEPAGVLVSPYSWVTLALVWLLIIFIWKQIISNPEKLPALNYGALFYALLIGTVLYLAFIAGLKFGRGSWMIFTGALLFYISDTIIGITDIGGIALKKPHLWIWLTYIPGQMGIIYGIWLSFAALV